MSNPIPTSPVLKTPPFFVCVSMYPSVCLSLSRLSKLAFSQILPLLILSLRACLFYFFSVSLSVSLDLKRNRHTAFLLWVKKQNKKQTNKKQKKKTKQSKTKQNETKKTKKKKKKKKTKNTKPYNYELDI